MKLIMSFHSESTTNSNDINISYYEKIPKIGENPLIIDFTFHQNFAIFAICLKHQTVYISRLAILSRTERYKRFFRSMYGCQDIWSTRDQVQHHQALQEQCSISPTPFLYLLLVTVAYNVSVFVENSWQDSNESHYHLC